MTQIITITGGKRALGDVLFTLLARVNATVVSQTCRSIDPYISDHHNTLRACVDGQIVTIERTTAGEPLHMYLGADV